MARHRDAGRIAEGRVEVAGHTDAAREAERGVAAAVDELACFTAKCGVPVAPKSSTNSGVGADRYGPHAAGSRACADGNPKELVRDRTLDIIISPANRD